MEQAHSKLYFVILIKSTSNQIIRNQRIDDLISMQQDKVQEDGKFTNIVVVWFYSTAIIDFADSHIEKMTSC
jgi:hypothetical protein